jgi:hypothetical protein
VAIISAPTVAVAQQRRGQPRTFVDLSYPTEALAARVAGTVVVRVTMDESFRVVEAEPLLGPATLRPAVLANVRQWTLAPGPRTDVLVYRFEVEHGTCNDDSRSLFRLVHRNLALITACTGPRRAFVFPPSDDVPVESYGTPPPYPQIAKSARITDAVVLDVSIADDGRVTEVRVLTGLPIVTETAIAHVKTWRMQTTSARHRLVIYEFAFDDALCKLEDFENSVFRRLDTNHVRLSVCGTSLVDVTSGSRE